MANSNSSSIHSVLIAGEWRAANATGTFTAANPTTGQGLGEVYPVSAWSDVETALDAAARAFAQMQQVPRAAIAEFLTKYADLIDARADAIVAAANEETGLAVQPRLRSAELPRTTGQLRQAAQACVDSSWRLPTIDAAANLRSVLEPIGPVLVFGPNNFPLAFNGIAGGDFAAAIAAGCPVIAKAHRLHPTTSRLLAEAAHEAASHLPTGTVQMLYVVGEQDGMRLVADPRLGAVAFTGSRSAGMRLKHAADAVGKPMYVELSSINPVVLLPGALHERPESIASEFVTSALMGAGQFCTNPGLLLLVDNPESQQFLAEVAKQFASSAPSPLLGERVRRCLGDSVATLQAAGAKLIVGGVPAELPGFAYQNTLLQVDADTFCQNAASLQTEAFGNCTLAVVGRDVEQLVKVLTHLEGNLTGCIYSATTGIDDADYDHLAPVLHAKVGRLLNDKMPTGVAVSPAMNHGGPFPATGHPHFTAVGLPAACRRFTRLVCYDNVRPHRLPDILRS